MCLYTTGCAVTDMIVLARGYIITDSALRGLFGGDLVSDVQTSSLMSLKRLSFLSL